MTGSTIVPVQNYWNHSRVCRGVQRIGTTIGRSRSGKLMGELTNPVAYGGCVGPANYAVRLLKNGCLRITRGWTS